MTDPSPDRPAAPAPSRRRFLELGGGAVAAAVLAACSSDAKTATRRTRTTTTSTTTTPPPTAPAPITAGIAPLTAADFDGLGQCTLLPELTAGPFPLDRQFLRRDVTEGEPGHPLRLGLRLVDADCRPIDGAVEIWHCDSTGDYSAFADHGGGKDAGPGTTFLRGTQAAGPDGIVEFQTIYPGWYRGRAVHIHVRARVGEQLVATSQLFFTDVYTKGVYADAPYAQFGLPDTSNAQDSIAGDVTTNGTLLTTTRAQTSGGAGTQALLNLGVPAPDRS